MTGVSTAERIRNDMVSAMKAREKERVSVLRMLLAALKDATIERRGEELGETEVMRLLMSYAKKREQTLAQMREAGREDLARKEEAELAVVREYLPAPFSDEELDELVRSVVDEVEASSMRDMGRVMKVCQERAGGRAEAARLSAVVKRMLAG